MVRERQKSIKIKQPAEPSLILWLLVGVMALLSGLLLFWLHSRQLLGPFQIYDIHVLSAAPLLIWLILICLRSWLYNMAFHRYWRDVNEMEQTQEYRKK